MKAILTLVALIAASVVWTQGYKNNTLDVNYNLAYKDIINVRMYTQLNELNNWEMRGFNSSMMWRIVSGLNATYDLSRSMEANAKMISRYGLGYQYAKQNFNLNLSLHSVNGTVNNDGWHGRIDFSIKFN